MGNELTAELAALRGEITELRQVLAALLQLLVAQEGGRGLAIVQRPPEAPSVQAPPLAVAEPALAPPTPSATPTTTLLARRNAQRLNDEVQRRTAAGLDPEGDTAVDLLIDRLHDLVDPL